MRIAVINETSCADRNEDIINGLYGFEHEIFNVGMKCSNDQELTYIETGLLGAILLNLKKVDFVIGGCGTGQGFFNAVMQYPNVFCGLIQEPVDAWLFGQINGGNCVSLVLNKGYGWAADVNLRFIFERLFSVEFGCGYPNLRKQSQQKSRKALEELSFATHISFEKILMKVETERLKKVLEFDGVKEVIDIKNMDDSGVKQSIIRRYQEFGISY